MITPDVTLDLALDHGLSEEEFQSICNLLGRKPTYAELGVYSVMWSEHCGYKNSIAVLKTLPRTGKGLLAEAGEENAGLVDIGDGLAIAFKIESHNHPSAIEPYNGAATGVGGILRDIFTMGARPIAVLNSLRFGNPANPRTKSLIRGVVRGISDYGNSFGVPTVGGEIYFDDCYNDNPLVNAMAVGVVQIDRIAKSTASGPGNPVLIVGSATGRDGIHGATFASAELSENSEQKRPSVQVGDPFTEKLLLEATLEAIRSGHLVGIQDMGAAGIACSTSETSAKGNVGMEIDLDCVPMREEGMSAYELLLSESQERMLLIVEKGKEEEIRKIFRRWDVTAEVIGTVTEDGILRAKRAGGNEVSLPAESLVLGGGAPVYQRESARPSYLEKTKEFQLETLPEPSDLNQVLKDLLSSPNIGSKRWVYQQYDSMVRTNTLIQADGDAAVVRIKGTNKALALTTDCNSRYVYLNPRRGGEIAVAEAARNVACVGARPVAITNCLNFGNPYNPEVYYQFKEVVAGIGHACRVLETPVTGGNVSFYNEGPTEAIFPTPVIGMLGILESSDHALTIGFRDQGDEIIMLGEIRGEIGGSEYLKICHGLVAGDAPSLDLYYERRLQSLLADLGSTRLLNSAHDVSEGGIAVCLAECCINSPKQLGGLIRLPGNIRDDFKLFGEDQGVVIVTCELSNLERIESIARRMNVPAYHIGTVGGEDLEIDSLINLSVKEATERWGTAVEQLLE